MSERVYPYETEDGREALKRAGWNDKRIDWLIEGNVADLQTVNADAAVRESLEWDCSFFLIGSYTRPDCTMAWGYDCELDDGQRVVDGKCAIRSYSEVLIAARLAVPVKKEDGGE